MTTPHSSTSLAWLSALLIDQPEVTQRSMFGCPAFFTGGRMFACVYEDTIGLKLSAPRVTALLSTVAHPFAPYGKPPMRQWLAIRLPAHCHVFLGHL